MSNKFYDTEETVSSLQNHSNHILNMQILKNKYETLNPVKLLWQLCSRIVFLVKIFHFLINVELQERWNWHKNLWMLFEDGISILSQTWFTIDVYIVACEPGGVSNKPTLGSGQRQDTGSGIQWSFHRWTRPTREPPTCGANQGSTGFYSVKRRTTYKKI